MNAQPAARKLEPGLTIAEAQLAMAESFRAAGIESPEADTRVLLCAALHLSRAQLIAQCDRPLNPTEAADLAALVTRRLKREPVSRIVGEKEFWSLSLRVTPDVLVPRPETETIVEAALDEVGRIGGRAEPLRILDIGTGSGALLLALLKEMPNATGLGTDISTAALAVARSNAERLGLAARCKFLACNIAKPLNGPFDLIVSNPPYIARAGIEALDPEVRDFDPRLALDGGADGLDAYRAIAAVAPALLRSTSRLILELGAGQERPVRGVLATAGLEVKTVVADLAGIPRAAVAAAARSGNRAG
jgi:release factor glutamine methyltransferase